MTYYILLILVVSISANVYVRSPCPSVKTAENFDYKTFSNGKWYEYAKYPNTKENNGECGYAQYTPDGNSFKIKYYDYLHGKLRVLEGQGRLAAHSHGNIIFSFPNGSNKTATEYTFNVLFTDNKNYVLGYYCKYNDQKASRQDFAWILSRSKSLSNETKAAIDDYLKSSYILDEKALVYTNFNEEECKNV